MIEQDGSNARFLIIRHSLDVREEIPCTGVVKSTDEKIVFFIKEPNSGTYLIEIFDDKVILNRTDNNNYTIQFVKNKEDYSAFSLENYNNVKFTTKKILIKQTANTYDLYISYDLFGQKQSIRIKCEKQ